jgi:hypothetical protein
MVVAFCGGRLQRFCPGRLEDFGKLTLNLGLRYELISRVRKAWLTVNLRSRALCTQDAGRQRGTLSGLQMDSCRGNDSQYDLTNVPNVSKRILTSLIQTILPRVSGLPTRPGIHWHCAVARRLLFAPIDGLHRNCD